MSGPLILLRNSARPGGTIDPEDPDYPLVPAVRADAVTDGVGVNTHLNFQSGTSSWSGTDNVEAAIQHVIDLGIKHVRGRLATTGLTTGETPRAMQRLAWATWGPAGVKWTTGLLERTDASATEGQLGASNTVVNTALNEVEYFVTNYARSSTDATTLFEAFEGANEPNNDTLSDGTTPVPATTWAPQARNGVKSIWNQKALRGMGIANVHAIGVAMAREIGPSSDITIEASYDLIAPLGAWTDHNHVHLYTAGAANQTIDEEMDRWKAASERAYGAVTSTNPIVNTERGWSNAMAYVGGAKMTTEAATNVYLVRDIISSLKHGYLRYFIYELLNTAPNTANDSRTNNFGLIRCPSLDPTTWTRKPAFHSLRRLLALFNDRDATTKEPYVFDPQPLPFNVDYNGSDNAQTMLFQKSRSDNHAVGGDYMLAMWRNASVWDWTIDDSATTTGTVIAVPNRTMTINLKSSAVVTLYRPSQGGTAATAAGTVLNGGSPVTTFAVTDLAAELVVAKIAPVDSSSGTANALPFTLPHVFEPEGDTVGSTLDMYSIRSAQMTTRMGSSDPTINAIANEVHTAWVGDWVATANVDDTIAGYVTAAAGDPFACVLYAIPNRDSGGYSSGGFTTRAAYLAWITACRTGSGSAPVWWILEPDALGHAQNFTDTARAERQETLRQAVVILAQNTNARIYIDASQWVTAANMAALLGPAGIGTADGISVNVSNFMTTASMNTYGNAVIAALNTAGTTGKKYVIDTSRNGNGPLETDYPGSSVWHNTAQTWCNPPGRGAGLSPRIPTNQPNCDAYLWIKMIGESDGSFPTAAQQDIFDTDAPAAGTWWDEWFTDYATNTDAANLS